MGRIAVQGMKFFAYHGCMPEEQVTGNHYIVDVSFEAPTGKAEKTDELEDTYDYARVFELVKKEMKMNSKLLEHLARRIIDAVSTAFPKAKKIEVKVAKLNPPIAGEIDQVSVVLSND